MKTIFTLLLIAPLYLVSSAQNFCDSLYLLSIEYSPFLDSSIVIVVENNSSQLFDYPAFVIIDQDGDTAARELVNYFGIGGLQTHHLNILDDAGFPSIPNATVQLWTGFYDTVLCSYSLDLELCPDTCVYIYPNIGNFGGAIAINTISWELKDSVSSLIASGTFELTASNQQDYDTVCVPPGRYIFEILPYTHTGGQLFGGVGALQTLSTITSFQTLPTGNTDTFSFQTKCQGVINSVEVVTNDLFEVHSHGENIYISSIPGKPIGHAQLINSSGAIVYSVFENSSSAIFPTAKLATGIYFVRVNSKESHFVRKFFLH